MPAKPRPIADRFCALVDRLGPVQAHAQELGPCWMWLGSRDKSGYGRFSPLGRKFGPKLATHVAMFLQHGRWPEKQCVLHKCDNPSCVNPEHLMLGTHADNVRDKISKGRQRHAVTRGEDCARGILTAAMVETIRSRHTNGETYREIAASLGIKKGTAKAAGCGQNWGWL